MPGQAHFLESAVWPKYGQVCSGTPANIQTFHFAISAGGSVVAPVEATLCRVSNMNKANRSILLA